MNPITPTSTESSEVLPSEATALEENLETFEDPESIPEEPPPSSDTYGAKEHNVTTDQVRQLLSKVDALNRADEEDLLASLEEALELLNDDDKTNDGFAAEKYREISEMVAKEETQNKTSQEYAGKLREAEGNIVSLSPKKAPEGSYGLREKRSEEKTEDVKQALRSVAEALEEPDREKRKEKWDGILETLSRWDTQNKKKGPVNDRAHLLFNILYGELKEEGLKEALRSKAIPEKAAQKIADLLTLQPGEMSSMKDVTRRQIGGPEWTHATAAEFFRTYSKKSSEEEEAAS